MQPDAPIYPSRLFSGRHTAIRPYRLERDVGTRPDLWLRAQNLDTQRRKPDQFAFSCKRLPIIGLHNNVCAGPGVVRSGQVRSGLTGVGKGNGNHLSKRRLCLA